MNYQFEIKQCLQRMNDPDKDLRHMALYDLQDALSKGFKVEEQHMRSLTDLLMKLLLEDASTDVQGMAVKSLPAVLGSLNGQQVTRLIESCTKRLVPSDAVASSSSDAAAARDVASLALKSIIAHINVSKNSDPLIALASRLTSNLTSKNVDTALECADVLHDLTVKCGTLYPKIHESIIMNLLPLLAHRSSRKRATRCLAAVSVVCGDAEFSRLVLHLIDNLAKTEYAVPVLGAVSQSSGHRLGAFLQQTVGPLLAYGRSIELADESEANDARETVLLTLDHFVVQCPRDMAPHLDAVTHYACDSLKFDPNYNDVDVEEDDVDMDDADDSEVFDDEYVDDSGFAEDDDSSWKVRRMSARLLAHIVQLNGVAPDTLRFAAQNLVNRLREREESVLMDILYALVALVGLHGTQPVSMPAIEMATVPGAKPRKGATVPSPRLIGAQVELLRAIVSAASSASLPGYIAASRAALDPAIAPSSRVVAVELLSVACRSHQASAFSGQCGMITDIASRACEDRYYRLVAAGVTLAGDIAVCVAQLPSEMAAVTPRIAALVSKSLDANDVDREIKEAAICAAATVLAYLHPTLETAVGQRLLSAVLDRVRNESTRLAAVRAIKVIASSTSPYAKQVAADFIALELVPLLRKSSRILVEASLEALIALAQAGLLSSLDGTALVPLLDSEPNALNLLRVFFERSPTAARSTVEPLVDALVELPVARGFRNVDALVSVLKLLPSPQALVPRFLQCVSTMSQQHGKLGKTTLQCTARVVGMLGADAQAFHSLVLSDCSEDMRVFGLLVLGYLRDASSVAIMKDMYTATQRYSEDIRAAAAAALGNILDTESVLRLVTQAVASNSASDVYMALQSLREHLVVHHVKLDAGSRARAVGVLEPLARAESEAVRSVVADCLARIGDLSLLLRITSDYLQQATALTALRIMISSQDGIASPEDLRRAVEALIPLGRRPSTPSVDSAPVRRAALLLVQTLAHQRPVLLKASPAAAAVATEIARAETVRDESLVRTVQLGPQKHEQDDGLELRKTALETILNLRDTNVLACDDAEFVSTLAQSIGSDKSMDVRGLAARILLKTMKAVSATLQNRTQVLTDLSLALKSMLALKVKQDALDQERERHDATLSLGLRIIVGVEHYVKGAEGNQQFKALLTESVTDDLAVRYKKIAQEEETEQR